MLIQIFTDGGSYNKGKNGEYEFDGSSALIVKVDGEQLIEETKVHIDKTNNYSEIWAIARGLHLVFNYLKAKKTNDFKIELYTDSMLCINSLCVWIHNWLKKEKDGVLYSSTGQKVKNQELILIAYKYVKRFGFRIKFFHINSHIPTKSLEVYYKKFITKNKVKISFDDFLMIVQANEKCDGLCKEVYEEYKNSNE